MGEVHIGFTGTQRGVSDAQWGSLRRCLVSLGVTDFHHGDCVGADAEADLLARQLGARIHLHVPSVDTKRAFRECREGDSLYGPKPYLLRNRDIVNACSVLIACPGEMEEVLRSGTWSTVRYARKVGREVRIVYPDGSVG